MIQQALFEAAIPFTAGIILTAKLIKNRQNKIFYLGPIILLFSLAIFIKSFVNAEQGTLADVIAKKLKGSYKLPVEVDLFTTLKDIKASSDNEVSYYYILKLEDFSTVEKEDVLGYACSNNNYKEIFKNGYLISFRYEDTKGKEIGKITSSKEVCNSLELG